MVSRVCQEAQIKGGTITSTSCGLGYTWCGLFIESNAKVLANVHERILTRSQTSTRCHLYKVQHQTRANLRPTMLLPRALRRKRCLQISIHIFSFSICFEQQLHSVTCNSRFSVLRMLDTVFLTLELSICNYHPCLPITHRLCFQRRRWQIEPPCRGRAFPWRCVRNNTEFQQATAWLSAAALQARRPRRSCRSTNPQQYSSVRGYPPLYASCCGFARLFGYMLHGSKRLALQTKVDRSEIRLLSQNVQMPYAYLVLSDSL
jgi:hypothetical protein